MGIGADDMNGDHVAIEISGLSVYTHHGVSDAEQEIGQVLVLDLRIESPSVGALQTDDVADTVDYGAVSLRVADLATAKSFRTLEALISMIADTLIAEFAISLIWIRATKPEPPVPLAMDGVSVELVRQAQ
ncbi:MAG: dihydroneopterin aldolase [Actinomycetes bacterium]